MWTISLYWHNTIFLNFQPFFFNDVYIYIFRLEKYFPNFGCTLIVRYLKANLKGKSTHVDDRKIDPMIDEYVDYPGLWVVIGSG